MSIRHFMYRSAAFAVTAGLSAGLNAGTAFAAPAAHPVIRVDAARPAGVLKDLRGVNGAPDMSFIKRPPPSPREASFGGGVNADVSAGYREAGVDLVRTHDSDGAADIDAHLGALPAVVPGIPPDAWRDVQVIFPDPKADPDDPKSYNFAPTDRLIAGIRAIGAQVVFRLGRSGMTTAEPPAEMGRYGEVIRHIVLHYNQGWANGFHDGIKYWEVWNEPDLGHIFWRGTPQQYYALYAAAAKAVKSADPTALIGGPTIAVVNETTPYREGFLDYVRTNHLPLDFFSWHWYSVDANDPTDFGRIGLRMRALLDHYGFTRTESVLDEWNYGLHDWNTASPAHRAAFVATSLIYMQDAPIDREALYRADRDFGPDGRTPDKTGQALIALGRMRPTPVRLAVSGADDKGLAVLAGRSSDGKVVQVLISNYRIPAEFIGPRHGDDVMHEHGLFDLALPPRRTVVYPEVSEYRLKIDHLAPDAEYAVDRYRLDDRQDFTLVDHATFKGADLALSDQLTPPVVELIVVTRVRP